MKKIDYSFEKLSKQLPIIASNGLTVVSVEIIEDPLERYLVFTFKDGRKGRVPESIIEKLTI